MSEPTQVFVVVYEDRHIDTDVTPFTSETDAVSFAESLIPDGEEGEEEELTPAMLTDGWVFYRCYGTEGDNVRVVRRDLR